MTTLSTTNMRNAKVIGLQGQNLGVADGLIIDTDTGTVTHLVLCTAWQNVTIPWDDVCFDSNEQKFSLMAHSPRQA